MLTGRGEKGGSACAGCCYLSAPSRRDVQWAPGVMQKDGRYHSGLISLIPLVRRASRKSVSLRISGSFASSVSLDPPQVLPAFPSSTRVTPLVVGQIRSPVPSRGVAA